MSQATVDMMNEAERRGWSLGAFPRIRERLRTSYLALAVVVSAWFFADGIPRIVTTLAQSRVYDFLADYLPAKAYRDGYDYYTPEGLARSGAAGLGDSVYGHPPTVPLIALPLTNLSLNAANVAWALLTVTLLLFLLVVLMNAVRCPAPNATAWLVFAFLIQSPTLLYHLDLGQLSVLIGLLYVLVWLELRAGRETTAGLALGAACSLKVFPGVLLLLPLVTRRYRTVGVALGTVASLAAVATAVFGAHSWSVFAASQPKITPFWMSSVQNASIHGVVARLFLPACQPVVGAPRAALIVSGLLSLAIIGSVAWSARRLPRDRASFDLVFGAFAIVSLLTSNWVWEHYKLVYILPLTLLLVTAVGQYRRGRPWWLPASALVTIAIALIDVEIGMASRIALRDIVLSANQAPEVRAAAHLELHVLEVINWLPLVLAAAVFGASLWDRARETSLAAAAAAGPSSR